MRTSMLGAECRSCFYFRYTEKKEGNCHRYPPTVVNEPDRIFYCHPVVQFEGWCGEYVHGVDLKKAEEI